MPRERTFAPENGSRLASAWTLSPGKRKIATCSPSTSAHTPAPGTMSSRRHTRIGMPSRDFKGLVFLSGARRADLAALGDEHDPAVGLVAVDEVAEALRDLRRRDRLLPLALVAVD